MSFDKNPNGDALDKAVQNTIAAGETDNNVTGLPQSSGVGDDGSAKYDVQALNDQIKQSASDANIKTEMTAQQVARSPIQDDEVQGDFFGGHRRKLHLANKFNKMFPESSEFDRAMMGASGTAGGDLLPSREMFLTKDQPIHVGNYSGKVIGNVPIYAAPAALVPLNIINQREEQLNKAAAQRAKKRNEAIKLLDIDTVEQWQGQMNEKRGEIIERYGKLTNYKYEQLTDMNNPAARKFHEEIRNLQALDEKITDRDTLAESILKKVEEDDSFVPPSVIQAALDVRNGTMSLDDILSNKGQKKWAEAGDKIQSYQNLTKVIDASVISHIQATTKPLLYKELSALSDSDKAELKQAYQIRNTGGNAGKQAWLSAIAKFYPEEDIKGAVDAVFDSNNVYKGFTPEEETAQRAIAHDYALKMLGETISTDLKIVDILDTPSGGSGGGGSDVQNPPYANLYRKYNSTKNKLAKDIAANAASGDDAKVVQARRNWASNFGYNIIEDGSGQFKAKVEFGGKETFIVDSNKVTAESMHIESPKNYGTSTPKRVNPNQYVADVKEVVASGGLKALDDKTRNTFMFLTGVTPDSIEEVNGATAKGSQLLGDNSTVLNQELVYTVEKDGERVVLSDALLNEWGSGEGGAAAVEAIMATAKPQIRWNVSKLQLGDKSTKVTEKSQAEIKKEVAAEHSDWDDDAIKAEVKKRLSDQTSAISAQDSKGNTVRWSQDNDFALFSIYRDLSSDGQAAGLDSWIKDVSSQYRYDKSGQVVNKSANTNQGNSTYSF